MPEATVAADLNESLYIEISLLSEVTFYPVTLINNLADAVYLLISEVFHPDIWIDTSLCQNFFAQSRSNAI
jgi:hypothetical protein